MQWFTRLYAKRIVNVNVNIILAGVLALAITVLVMGTLGKLGVDERIATKTNLSDKLIVGALTFVVDLLADVSVYYGLHWAANHAATSSRRILNPAYANLSFMKDATLVQVQRAALSPILYILALGGQHLMLHNGHSIAFSTTVGFVSGIAVTRILHTLWMIAEERKLRQKFCKPENAPPAANQPTNEDAA